MSVTRTGLLLLVMLFALLLLLVAVARVLACNAKFV